MPNAAATPTSFHDQWVPIFRSGAQTDSTGAARTWSDADLDAIVKNFDAANPPPLVCGHPKTDSPAWGWTSALKRTGNTLLAKFVKVPDAMVAAVCDGRYRNRSVKLAQGEHGWRLIHTGLLGAAPPAVEGLAPIAFEAEPDGITVEFSAIEAEGLSLLARGMQKLRELIIAHFGIDSANEYTPQADIDQLNSIADASRAADIDDDDIAAAPTASSFSRPTEEDRKMDAKLQADLAAERAKLAEAETKLAAFAARERVAEAKGIVDAALAAGRLTPAQAAGMPEFLASLDDATEVEFAAADGTAKKPQAQFLREFIAALPKQIELGKQHEGVDATPEDADAIGKAAHEYQAAEKAKGVDVPWHEAVTHVTRKH